MMRYAFQWHVSCRLMAASLLLTAACDLGPCVNFEDPVGGSCACSDGEQLAKDQCPACDAPKGQDRGEVSTDDISGDVLSLCSREYRVQVADRSVLGAVLDADSGGVTVRVTNLSGTKQFGTISASSSEKVQAFALDSGRYLLEVSTASRMSVRFHLHLEVSAYDGRDDDADQDKRDDDNRSSKVEPQQGDGDIGALTGLKTIEGFSADSMDESLYSFSLPNDSTLTWQLRNVEGSAFGQLFRNVGLADKSKSLREIRATSAADGNDQIQLEHGSYQLRVTSATATPVLYTLGINAEPYKPAAPSNDPGSDKGAAMDAGTLTTLQQFSGFVGTSDPEDYYRVELKANASLQFSLSNVLGQATAQLFTDEPLIDEAKPVSAIQASENRDANHTDNLQRGIYYVRVIPTGSSQALYRLGLSAE